MGCDIHLYFEMKDKEGVWNKIEIDERLLPDQRDYFLFSFLADVRNFYDKKIESQFANRGLPDNHSMPHSDGDDDFYMGDHSFTFAYLDEILKAPWKENQYEHSYFYIFCRYVLPRLIDICGQLSSEQEKNIRVIMGFDN